MTLDESLTRLLACPRCHGPLEIGTTRIACRAAACGDIGRVDDNVLLFADPAAESFFDDRTRAMDRVVHDPGTQALFYERQSEVAHHYLEGAPIILDVGCGGVLQYPRPSGSRIIGVDLSRELLRKNKELDTALYASATELPVADRSVDRVVCFYAVHHFIGGSVAENRSLVERSFSEFGRVLRANGELLVFDLSPWWPAWLAQCAVWNSARRALGSRLDMFFWRAGALQEIAARRLGRPASASREIFRGRVWKIIPAGVGLTWLRVPRAVYPFEICLYRWRLV
jgi:SAM-dependent methyltransferase